MAEQLAHHDSTFMKLDSFYATIQNHSDSLELLCKNQSEPFDLLRTSLASQQTIMVEIMVKL